MKKIKLLHRGFRFPGAVICCAVRWYHRLDLSLRDIDELLLERAVSVRYGLIHDGARLTSMITQTVRFA